MLSIETHVCNTNTLEVEATLAYRVRSKLIKYDK